MTNSERRRPGVKIAVKCTVGTACRVVRGDHGGRLRVFTGRFSREGKPASA